ncbi:MAG: hypothetical protein K6G80_05680 [Treponema sp.]|nr:hypothetical protein [Treponema sp.]
MKKNAGICFTVIFVLLLAAAGFLFFRGWVQFSVGVDECGVLVSKTGGVYKMPVEKGRFVWRWEPLLPTNATLLRFSKQNWHCTKRVSGALPSAEIYSLQIQQNPDFTYSFDFDIALQLRAEELVDLVESGAIQHQDDIEPYFDKCAQTLAEHAARYIISASNAKDEFPLPVFSSDEIVSAVSGAAYKGVQVHAIFVTASKIPDLNIYETAKNTFETFASQVNTELAGLARRQAELIVSDNRAVNKLVKVGETLKNYPELAEVLKNSDAALLLKSLETVR